jgi:hypothetical protein
VYLFQNENNITCQISESYEEWDAMIQKLKEKNSELFGSDQISESAKDSVEKEEE